jgi:uncharacterized membrane protein YoaK (UPF0700 family)
MFKHQGPSRSPRQNATLAAYLAFVAGFVNSSGFVLIGSFTSHVTGNVGRLANDIASHDPGAATGALTMIGAFLAGAFAASMIIESDALGTVAYAYGAALAVEATLLVAFTLAFAGLAGGHLLHDFEGALLCGAMGMQNSLVTRLSGAVVRTTHLTGVITDLGIEGARWFRWWRSSASAAWGVRLAFGRGVSTRPAAVRIVLLATIVGAFLGGAIAGAAAGVAVRQVALLFPAVCLVAGAGYAFSTGRSGASSR